jgi:hypothetical protein
VGSSKWGLGLWQPGFEDRTAAVNAKRLLDTSRTTPDGNVFVFESDGADLTPYPTEGHVEVYRYDAVSENLDCISCGSFQAAATADAELVSPGVELSQRNQHLEISNLSDDGRQVVFETSAPLLPEDVNQKADVYQWRDGTLSLISTGHAVEASTLLAATPSGKDIFFKTGEKLVPGGQEPGRYGIYDARVEGGLASQQAPPSAECTGESCQGQPNLLASPPTLGSMSLAGNGNIRPKRCRGHRARHHHHRRQGHRRGKKPSARRKPSGHLCSSRKKASAR